jgi:integrating conjugative element protein (TIGR03749 family)
MNRARLCGWAIAAGLLLELLAPVSVAATRVWRQVPIRVDLVVGVEQLLVLPDNGTVGLPPALANPGVFRTLVTGGTAYWTALEPFTAARIKVRLATGEYLLFDVSARTEKAPPAVMETLQVVLPADDEMPTDDPGDPRPATLFELIRYAAQALYSPTRLIAPVPGVRPVPVGLRGNMTALYDQGRHPGLVLQPHQAWAAGGLYVTAFIVTNEHSHRLVLDNRKVRHTPTARRTGVAPHFIASAFFEAELAPRGQPGHRTTLFVVTDQPIRSVVGGR